MTDPNRWEHGSEFHWPLAESDEADLGARPWASRGALLGSGRDALRLIIQHGLSTLDWERLWVPSYMCQHVVEALVETGISCVVYEDAPTQAGPTADTLNPSPRDVVLLVNYFGLRDSSIQDGVDLGGATLIVDHTHDPLSEWAHDRRADYAIASLRKTVPIPDGGVLWSPKGHALPAPPEITETRAMAAQAKWKAMRLKGHYLAGELVNKADFRALAFDGEADIARGAISGMYPASEVRLDALPLGSWRARRRANHDVLVSALAEVTGLKVLTGSEGSCPFSAFLVCEEPAQRDLVRTALIEARIYPAVLWPMDTPALSGVSEAHCALADRTLSVHCDMRYDPEDMARVATVIAEACAP
ncbi:MAG: hypothetical protein ACPGU1_12905 [Myxococcota bacterium]